MLFIIGKGTSFCLSRTDADQNPNLENNDNGCRDIQDIHIEDVTESRDGHEDLEESEPLDAVEPRQDTHVEELEEVLDELFNRSNPAESVEQVLGEIIMTGEKVVLSPRLEMNLTYGALDFLPETHQ